ncbi:hypothetical protein Fcan01_26644 [Folsomia candida]|uniref:Uncharacterized protein n=1 Tax=Folsomia candida TaxID=158441 RepID=A0A226D183_FOLCA|nr:hypothetical protein Fcan01_26644 [Folsomia candida]
MACIVGAHLQNRKGNFGKWKCQPLSTNDLTRQESSQLKTSLKQTTDLDVVDVNQVCPKCIKTFGRRRYNRCQHKHHLGQRARHPKNLHFITAEERYSTHKHLGLLPNDAICNSKECKFPQTPNVVSFEEDEPPPAKKKKALEDLNRIRQILDPTAEPPKRNAAGQSFLIKSSISQVQDSIIKTFEEEGLKIFVPEVKERIQQLEEDSESFHWIMNELKIRLEGCSRAEAKSLLTIAPPNWSVYNTSAFFRRSEHLVRSSRKRREEAGCILPPIKPKNGRKLSESAKLAVQEFYYRDDVSQPGPGLRDVLSIFNPSTKKREKKQKRYLRSNLKELYQLFKMDHPQEKIGMTSFCTQRPRECLSQNSKGFHNVCLCIYHENVKLLFNAVGLPSMKPYIEQLVCPGACKNCYYRRCYHCKKNTKVLLKKIKEDSKVLKNQETISYRRWLSTNGTHLSKEEFLDHITQSLEELLKHHYIYKNQQDSLNKLKNNLKEGEIIVWGDFSENYTPIIQGAVQSEYFSHKQVTLHPFTIYWRARNSRTGPGEDLFKTYNATYCIVSDSTQHDTNSFFAFQKFLILKILEDFKAIGVDMKHIHYFSDGCAAQYKNRKNFANLFHHKRDFGVTAEWHFFATAHGKGPCDAAGGTTKRLLRTASLQGNIITTAEDVFNWAKKSILQIEYMLITADQVGDIVDQFNLERRYDAMTTIAGTQQGHHFTVSEGKIFMYETSMDSIPSAVKNMKGRIDPVQLEDCAVNDWIACVYDSKWYIAVVDGLDSETQELKVAFWKSNSGPKGGKSFISENASCFIPIGNVLKKLTSPKQSGRRRKIAEVSLEEQEHLDQLLLDFQA